MNSDFLEWDGKSTDFLVYLLSHTKVTSVTLDHWIDLLSKDDQKTKRASTWLIKEALKSGIKLSEAQTRKLLDEFMHIEDWETKLHILQSFQFINLSHYSTDHLYEALKYTLHSDIKFLRAWSYDAFYRLALVDQNYQKLFHDQLTWGMENESGSISARIKNIVKDIDKNKHKIK